MSYENGVDMVSGGYCYVLTQKVKRLTWELPLI